MWVNINDWFKKDFFKIFWIKHLKQKIFKRVKVYNVEIKWMTRKAQKNKKIIYAIVVLTFYMKW